jgi:hypothetical protein
VRPADRSGRGGTVPVSVVRAPAAPGANAGRDAASRRFDADTIAAAILTTLATRRPPASACPSEVARRLDPVAWRGLMDAVRAQARVLAVAGAVEVTQGGRALDPRAPWRGPIRLRAGKTDAAP